MKQIMPHGYTKAATRNRLIEQFTKARAQELASATPSEQKRISKEIESQVENKLLELYGKSYGQASILRAS